MAAPGSHLSRISKLFADRDATVPDDALRHRSKHSVTLVCGTDIADSRTLQLAVLTAARIAVRCFPGAVRVAIPERLHGAALKIWPHTGQTFGSALAGVLGSDNVHPEIPDAVATGNAVLFGNAPAIGGALRATFDGWIGCAGPADTTMRMREREFCSLAGILAGSLAISEIFMAFAGITLLAGRRIVSLSLWRPDLAAGDPEALGVPAPILPQEAWLLGLGHLGNAYLWSLATLPYRQARDVRLYLNDFDIVEESNLETGVLFAKGHEDELKTRVLSGWLEALGFRTRLLERRFDDAFRLQQDEPELAFCGFDTNPARRHLATARFAQVVESGLGGMASNFDTINLHTFPNERTAEDLWPDLDPAELDKQRKAREALARENAAYGTLTDDECGRVALAGKSIAVPFVGVAASTLVVAESLRVLLGGPAYAQVKLWLATPSTPMCRYLGNYRPEQAAGLKFVDSAKPDPREL
jgi:hypothetical protein